MHPAGSATFDIVLAALPYVDRRALSQAWYCALHVAQAEPLPVRFHPRAKDVSGDPPAPRLAPAARGCSAARGGEPAAAVRRAGPRAAFVPVARLERVRPARDLSLRITRALCAPRNGATIDIRHDGERIRILVRAEGGRMRLIAVCRPALREVVDRALLEVRSLLGRGEACWHTAVCTGGS